MHVAQPSGVVDVPPGLPGDELPGVSWSAAESIVTDRELLTYRVQRLSPTLGPAVFALFRDIDDGAIASHRIRELGTALVSLGAELSAWADEAQRIELCTQTLPPRAWSEGGAVSYHGRRRWVTTWRLDTDRRTICVGVLEPEDKPRIGIATGYTATAVVLSPADAQQLRENLQLATSGTWRKTKPWTWCAHSVDPATRPAVTPRWPPRSRRARRPGPIRPLLKFERRCDDEYGDVPEAPRFGPGPR